MSDAPERIFLNPETKEDGPWTPSWKVFAAQDNYSIPYRRELECRWEHAGEGMMRPREHAAIVPASRVFNWTYCPYCGGRIRIEEDA